MTHDTATRNTPNQGAPDADTPPPDVLNQFIVHLLEDGQAEDIVSIPLAGKSAIADFMIVASGRSSRQIGALSQRVMRGLKKAWGIHARIEGLTSADWVLIDAFDVIVHIFRPEVRRFYALEKMWELSPADAPDRPELSESPEPATDDPADPA